MNVGSRLLIMYKYINAELPDTSIKKVKNRNIKESEIVLKALRRSVMDPREKI